MAEICRQRELGGWWGQHSQRPGSRKVQGAEWGDGDGPVGGEVPCGTCP